MILVVKTDCREGKGMSREICHEANESLHRKCERSHRPAETKSLQLPSHPEKQVQVIFENSLSISYPNRQLLSTATDLFIRNHIDKVSYDSDVFIRLLRSLPSRFSMSTVDSDDLQIS